MNKEEKCWFCFQSQVVAASENWDMPRVDLIYYAGNGGPAFCGIAYAQDKSNHTSNFYINYCPICGRKLSI